LSPKVEQEKLDWQLDDLAGLMRREYGIEVRSVSPVDAGLEVPKAIIDVGDARYLVKLHPVYSAAALEFSFWLTTELARRGCRWVVKPVMTTRRTPTAPYRGRLVEVRPYVEARSLGPVVAAEDFEQFGAVIADLHAVGAFATARLVSDDAVAVVPRLEAVIERAAAVPSGDDRSAAARLIIGNRAALRRGAELADRRRPNVDAVRPRWTATHGDATPHNFLRDPTGGVYLIDWSSACTAPAERDVMHYLSPDRMGFIASYRRRHPDAEFDRPVFEYYLSRWQIGGVIEFGGRLFADDEPIAPAPLMTALEHFAPDRTAAIAAALAVADERLCRRPA
jgi:spectinomycin phosphotransferase